MSEDKKRFTGHYSAECDERFGHAVWLTPSGDEVLVTDVVVGLGREKSSKWDDSYCVGEVCSCVRGRSKYHDFFGVSNGK